MPEEGEMLLISKVAEETGVSVNTIRFWARQGWLGEEAERRDTPVGPAWFATIRAVLRLKDNPPVRGRPPRTNG